MNVFRPLIGLALLALPATALASSQPLIAMNDPSISPAIIGGQQAGEDQLPFFARLILHRTGESKFSNICGGSVVNDRYIMTAAHCVYNDVFVDGWTENDLRVLLKNPTGNDVYVEEFKDVRNIIIHPEYNPDNFWINDIALLELTYPITDNVQSITLPQDFGDYSDKSAYQIFGLGLTDSSQEQGPDYLQTAEVMPLSDTQCYDMLPAPGFNADESLCANGFPDREYTAICAGDSGGPLTYLDDNHHYQQIGIVSYGAKICETESIPSVFTEVLHYNAWIESHSSSGVKTTYDPALAQSEGYHSQGDNGFEPEDKESKKSNSGGGALNAWLLMLGGMLAWNRRRKPGAKV
ncbi:serine protease [Vibrio sp. CAU 1672]|uniref:S1 family peptidase n=1 Tax=Vibrio sp. CAU 1672 TaxID=3032594 RepID=UPI0023DC8631|nr:serine protease [Vibrio sp. CAU 1672]MDF2152630.1 serine protease [Vibrio sp. CAU 1672]